MAGQKVLSAPKLLIGTVEMDNVTRIGVSLEPDLLAKFDDLIASKGYVTRSEAFRDLIRDALTRETLQEDDAKVCGTVTLLYNHNKGGLKERLMEIQHAQHHLISSSIHVHQDLERCLEVLIVFGTVREIKELADSLGSVRGVASGIPVMLSSEIEDHDHQDHVHLDDGSHRHRHV
jgi:CopG family nickel-responsive transcriptional regulator